MLKLIKRWANRHEIAELQLELKSLEARFPSMEDKVFRSRGTAEMWEKQVKVGLALRRKKMLPSPIIGTNSRKMKRSLRRCAKVVGNQRKVDFIGF